MTWEEVKELAPLYVIGALDEETARAVEASLRDVSPDQQRVVAQWHDVAALLPQALPLQTPPDYLKERLFNRIASESWEAPAEIEVGAITESAESWKPPVEIGVEKPFVAEGADGANVDGAAKVLPFAPPKRIERIESRAQRWLLIAATALLAFTSAYLFGQNAKLAREQDAWKQKVDDIARERDEWMQKVNNFVSPTTRVIAMAGNEVPGANAKVVWDTNAQRWVIYIFNLPAPPSNKDYQLWYVTNNAKISATTFTTDAQGQTILRLTLPPGAITGLAATAVTLEPKGGSPQPTSSKFYLVAKI
jgi:anti-sigma-K factor RskA